VKFAVFASPVRNPAGFGVVEHLTIRGLQSICKFCITAALRFAVKLGFKVCQAAPGTINQRVGVGIFPTMIHGVKPVAGPVRFNESVGIARLGGLHKAVKILIAPGEIIRHEFQAADPLFQPCKVAGGLHIIPAANERPRIRVQKIRIIPIAHHLAAGVGTLIEPKVHGASYQGGHRNAFRHHGSPQHVIGIEDQGKAAWIAEDVVGKNPWGELKGRCCSPHRAVG